MNKIKWMLLTLIAVCISASAFAQSTEALQTAKFTKALEKAALNAKKNTCIYCGKAITAPGQHCSAQGYVGLCSTQKAEPQKDTVEAPATHCPVCGEKLSIDERFHGAKHVCPKSEETAAPVCAYCNKSIESAHQHCAAQGYAGLCSPEKAETQKYTSDAPASICPVCGEKLSIDERFHGVKHVCPNDKETKSDNKTASAKHKKYCIYCGEEITSSSQHCSAAGYNTLCTENCPQCGLNLRDPKNLGSDGVHRCNLDKCMRLKPVPVKK